MSTNTTTIIILAGILIIAWAIFHLPAGSIPVPQFEVQAYDSEGNLLPSYTEDTSQFWFRTYSIIPESSTTVGSMSVVVPLNTATIVVTVRPTNTGSTISNYTLLSVLGSNTATGWSRAFFDSQNATNTTSDTAAWNISPNQTASLQISCDVSDIPIGSTQPNHIIFDVLGEDRTSALRQNYDLIIHKKQVTTFTETDWKTLSTATELSSSNVNTPNECINEVTGDLSDWCDLHSGGAWMNFKRVWSGLQGTSQTFTGATVEYWGRGSGRCNRVLAWNYATGAWDLLGRGCDQPVCCPGTQPCHWNVGSNYGSCSGGTCEVKLRLDSNTDCSGGVASEITVSSLTYSAVS